jgi:hypothetical protein
MEIKKDDIEEIGEAVEALGKMLETELKNLNLRLEKLEGLLSEPFEVKEIEEVELKEERKIPKPDYYELKKDTNEIREFLESFDVRLARVEQKTVELLREFEEENISSMKNDLFIIRKELEFIREDTKEILDKKEELDKKIQDLEKKIEGSKEELA